MNCYPTCDLGANGHGEASGGVVARIGSKSRTKRAGNLSGE